ncbi:MAG: AAA family ATPase [Lachnospiraceae bacterium]|nr:AAA family ATPase [Lachnospiraceae bacterium]
MIPVRNNKGRFFEIAKENYNTLLSYCGILNDEGYWKQAESILHMSIYEVLDRYIQSILISMAVSGGEMNEKERQFIVALPESKQFELGTGDKIPDAIIRAADMFLKSPPVILQLCSLRDYEKKTELTKYYFDALLNIMACMSYMNEKREKYIISYIKSFYAKVIPFLIDSSNKAVVNERYVFKKMTQDPELPKDLDAYKQVPLAAVPTFAEDNEIEIDAKDYEKTPEEEELMKKSTLDSLLEELNSLVGLDEVKKEIGSLINLIKVRKIREEKGLPQMDMSYHMVFTGSPGTGKTTIARLVSEIYKELGILSKGTLVETDRSGLVAGYVGQTALKVKEVVNKALGGILFIDEAYSLSNSDANDFGKEAIDTLVKAMEDHRDDLVVIVAGYTKEMKDFLAANTGLISRFNKFITFEDYTPDELLQIMISMAGKVQMKLSDEAMRSLSDYLINMPEEGRRIFGNARGIRNVFESAVVNQANRIVLLEDPSIEDLSLITDKDLKY